MSAGSASVRVPKLSGGSGGGNNASGYAASEAGGSIRSTRFRFLSWSPETYAVQEFLTSFPLPRVVRLTNCDEASLLKTLILPSDVDITQPLLFFKKYRPTKIMAKCLKVQKSGKWKETGPTVVIPDSFPGWFTLLSQEGKECAMTLTSMGQVAAARVPAFLTKFDVPVYKLTDSSEPGAKSVYVRSTTRAGSILRLLGVWADLGGANSYPHPQKSSANFLTSSLGSFGGRLVARSLSLQNTQPQQFQYVQCLSLDNEVLFIPFSATGVFYPIAPRGGRNPQHIYPLSAIAKMNRLPVRTKMVYGALPPNIPDFTGTLQLERVDTEDVVLACTLMRDKPLLFEIDLDCDLFLSQMTSEDLFIQSTGYQSAIQFCRAEADNWRRQVRVYKFGNKGTTRGLGGTVTGAFLMSVKEKNKSLRFRSSGATPSKLSLLFRPSSAPFGSGKDPLRRTKSFNVETQSVSISLDTQDEEEEETKKLSTLFNFMAGKKKNKHSHPPLQIAKDKDFMASSPSCAPVGPAPSSEPRNNVQMKPMICPTPSPSDIIMANSRCHQVRSHHLHPLKISQQMNSHQSYNNSVPDVLSNSNNHKNHSSSVLINSSISNNHNPLVRNRHHHHHHKHVLSLHCNGTPVTSHQHNGTNNTSSGSSGFGSLGNMSYGNGSLSLSLSPIPSGSSSTNSSGSASGGGKGSPDVPYGTVADEVTEEENIYSEISDPLAIKLSHDMALGLTFQQIRRHQESSNLSSLVKGGGGSDGTFSGTLSGTFSSSNPSNRDEDIYDAVF